MIGSDPSNSSLRAILFRLSGLLPVTGPQCRIVCSATLCRSAILVLFCLPLVQLVLALGAGAVQCGGRAPDRPRTCRSKSGIDAILGARARSGQEEFLHPDEAFQLSADADGPDKVRIEWAVHEGYYLYKSRIKVASTSTQAQLGAPPCPRARRRPTSTSATQEVYHDDLVATVSVSRPPGGALELPMDVTYQGCADAGLCYPPITKNLKVSAAGRRRRGGQRRAVGGSARWIRFRLQDRSPPSSETATCSSCWHLLRHRRGAVVHALRAADDPDPVRHHRRPGWEGHRRARLLPRVDVRAGHGAHVRRRRRGLRARSSSRRRRRSSRSPGSSVSFAALFVALALAMFGRVHAAAAKRAADAAHEREQSSRSPARTSARSSWARCRRSSSPHAWRPRLSARSVVISQTGASRARRRRSLRDWLGMGVPLLLVGASAGSLLPRVGPWMDTVKSLFGVLFLGVAIYFLRRCCRRGRDAAVVGRSRWCRALGSSR